MTAPRCTYCDASLMFRDGRTYVAHLSWCPRALRPRPTPSPAMPNRHIADAVTHRSDCTIPNVEPYIGRRGDPMEGCRTCHAFRVIPTDAPAANGKRMQAPGRYWLPCVRCDDSVWLDSPKAVVAVCEGCRSALRDHE